MKIVINSDVYNISKRIKDIENDYYIVFNTSKNSYEVHCSNQLDTSYCLTVPFKNLDTRTLDYVYQTKSENIDKILNQIESENKIKENAEKQGVLNDLNEALTCQ